jgi:alkylation response protein AidB-like acyl-CoA dehydrogenase
MTQTTLGYSDLYQLPDELSEFRSAVRTLAEDRICPRASEIDRTGAYPWDVRRPVAHERDYRVGRGAGGEHFGDAGVLERSDIALRDRSSTVTSTSPASCSRSSSTMRGTGVMSLPPSAAGDSRAARHDLGSMTRKSAG